MFWVWYHSRPVHLGGLCFGTDDSPSRISLCLAGEMPAFTSIGDLLRASHLPSHPTIQLLNFDAFSLFFEIFPLSTAQLVPAKVLTHLCTKAPRKWVLLLIFGPAIFPFYQRSFDSPVK
jgi:hypothetical protein